MTLFMDKYFIPFKCPCCGETIFLVCNKNGDIIDVIENEICKEYLDEKKKN